MGPDFNEGAPSDNKIQNYVPSDAETKIESAFFARPLVSEFPIGPQTIGLFLHKHKKKITILPTLLFILIGSIIFLRTHASSSNFYATTCTGSWQHPENATGVPDVKTDAPEDSFTENNSALLNRSAGELECGKFTGEIPTGIQAGEFTVHFSWIVADHLQSSSLPDAPLQQNNSDAGASGQTSPSDTQNQDANASSTPPSIPPNTGTVVPPDNSAPVAPSSPDATSVPSPTDTPPPADTIVPDSVPANDANTPPASDASPTGFLSIPRAYADDVSNQSAPATSDIPPGDSSLCKISPRLFRLMRQALLQQTMRPLLRKIFPLPFCLLLKRPPPPQKIPARIPARMRFWKRSIQKTASPGNTWDM